MPRFGPFRALVTTLIVAIPAVSTVHAQESESGPDLRVKIAEQTYHRLLGMTVQYLMAPPEAGASAPHSSEPFGGLLSAEKAEEFYRWSRRWMEAERDRAASKEQKIEAIEAHLERMRDHEEGLILREAGLLEREGGRRRDEDFRKHPDWTNSAFVNAMRYFRLEAEAWLAEAKR